MTTDTPTPRISILVCTRNRPEDLKTCVRTILENRFTDYELLVVDQGDGREVADFLAGVPDPRVRHVPTPTRGLSRARNIGIVESRAPIIAFTDDDCLCDPGWVGGIVRLFDEHPTVQGVYGRVLPHGDRFKEGLFCHCLIDDPDERLVRGRVPPHQNLGHGNNMAFRRELFRAIGIYNVRMGAGTRLKSGEDTDLSYRALRAGVEVLYSPAPLVYHNNWNTLEQAGRMDYGYVLGFVSIFGKFTLKGDGVAFRCLRHRLGELRKDFREAVRWKNRRRAWQTVGKVLYFFPGMVAALYFRFAGDPRYPATPAARQRILKGKS
ncbi:MAG: glycosyltransferase family 2 protein [Acidobacteria bacterium]|nr:glycosyltransferase family 2 protein [Acidobacteriota bacterium]